MILNSLWVSRSRRIPKQAGWCQSIHVLSSSSGQRQEQDSVGCLMKACTIFNRTDTNFYRQSNGFIAYLATRPILNAWLNSRMNARKVQSLDFLARWTTTLLALAIYVVCETNIRCGNIWWPWENKLIQTFAWLGRKWGKEDAGPSHRLSKEQRKVLDTKISWRSSNTSKHSAKRFIIQKSVMRRKSCKC